MIEMFRLIWVDDDGEIWAVPTILTGKTQTDGLFGTEAEAREVARAIQAENPPHRVAVKAVRFA